MNSKHSKQLEWEMWRVAHVASVSLGCFYPKFSVTIRDMQVRANKAKLRFYLASVGLYVTSYFSIGNAMSIGCCQLTRTDVGLMKVTVMFSGAAGIEPEMKEKEEERAKLASINSIRLFSLLRAKSFFPATFKKASIAFLRLKRIS